MADLNQRMRVDLEFTDHAIARLRRVVWWSRLSVGLGLLGFLLAALSFVGRWLEWFK
jgi:hypothetical protein